MKYYVYIIRDTLTNEFYIGSRSFNGEPIKDKYMGSPYTWKPNFSRLEKKIIKDDFVNMEESINFERNLILENISNPLNRNYSIPNGRFNRSNLVTAKDESGKIVTISKSDPLLGIKFFGVTKGMVVVKDSIGNRFHISVDDDRYKSGELVNVNKGLMLGEKHINYGRKQINNGVEQKLVSIQELENYIKDGWILGTLQKNKTTKSSHVDTIWVNNGSENKRITSSEIQIYLNLNWRRGRINLKKYERRK